MGLNLSTVINETINKTVNKATVTAQQNIVQENNQFTDVNQVVEIVIAGKLSCASLEINQDAKVNMRSFSMATADQKLTMAELVHQALV